MLYQEKTMYMYFVKFLGFIFQHLFLLVLSIADQLSLSLCISMALASWSSMSCNNHADM